MRRTLPPARVPILLSACDPGAHALVPVREAHRLYRLRHELRKLLAELVDHRGEVQEALRRLDAILDPRPALPGRPAKVIEIKRLKPA